MTINQNPNTTKTRYIDGKLHKESYIRDIAGYDKGTYSRKCECGEITSSMFIYVTDDPDRQSPVYRVEKYKEQEIPEGYKYSPIICSPMCSNNDK